MCEKTKNTSGVGNLTAALEDYIEAIAFLKREKKYARVGDIAKTLGIKSSSVNTAVNLLSENGLVTHEKYGYVDLTKEGEELAGEVQRKHDVLYKFLSELLFIEKSLAFKEACKIEHSVSSETIRRLEKLYGMIKDCYITKENISKLQYYMEEE